MENKLSYGCLLIAGGLTAFSCSQEGQMDELNFSRLQTSTAIQANVEDFVMTDGTRVNLDVNTLGVSFRWTAGDALGIFAASSPVQQVKYSIQKGEGTNDAVFVNDMDFALNPASQYAAYYPYSTSPAPKASGISAAYSGQAIAGNGSTSHLGKFDYLASAMTPAEADGNVSFDLKHMGSLVRFRLTMPEADSYSSFSLTSSGRQLIRQGKMSIATPEPCFVEADSVKTLTFPLSATSTTESDKMLTLYVMMAPEDYSQSDWALTVMGSKDTYFKTIKGVSMKAGKAYSYDVTFVTREAVDLGVVVNGKKVLWATCNVGAESPTNYGGYFAWGETVPNGGVDESNAMNYSYAGSYTKTYYYWNTYKYSHNGTSWDNSNLTKYCSNSSYGDNGFTDTKTVLDPEDDAATANWGADWRMPTYAELHALYSQCTWTWVTSYNGKSVKGYKVSGNGHEIFLPAAGYQDLSSPFGVGSYGYYWSSSLNESVSYDAYGLDFESGGFDPDYDFRYNGRSVRPVRTAQEYSVFVSSLSLNRTSLTLDPDATETLTVSVTPSNAESHVIWTSSDESVATVDALGVVTAKKAGTTVIRATTIDGTGKYAECNVTVKGQVSSGNAPAAAEAVDLGLIVDGKKVLWANMNVGAESPTDYGYYFAWGETVPCDTKNSYYDWNSYKYCKGSSSTMTKYVLQSRASSDGYNGYYDNKTILDSEDDAASTNWGGDWRMPTLSELKALRDKCTWTWITMNGVKGYKIVGSNDNFIFLPAAGSYEDGSSHRIGAAGTYWTSSLGTVGSSHAFDIDFDGGGRYIDDNDKRSFCQPIRPVLSTPVAQ